MKKYFIIVALLSIGVVYDKTNACAGLFLLGLIIFFASGDYKKLK